MHRIHKKYVLYYYYNFSFPNYSLWYGDLFKMKYTQCWKGSSEVKKVQGFLLPDYDLGIKKELKIGKSEMKSLAILEGWWYPAIKFCHIWAELAVCVRCYLHDGLRFFFIYSNFEFLLYPKIIIKQ